MNLRDNSLRPHDGESSSDGPTVAIETHGCKLNQADSDELALSLRKAGFRPVSVDEPADVYVVNSCTVTHVADRKARHALRAARRRNPDATIVATGCYVRRSPELLRRLGEVDIVDGAIGGAALVREIEERTGLDSGLRETAHIAGTSYVQTSRTRAMVKIQEGCDQVCAYCIVPKVRGRERSVAPKTIVSTIERHVAGGCKEVVLTGTQLGSYGFDLPSMTLGRLLEYVLGETDVVRLRVSSLQPQEITPELLGLWTDRRLCPHFHVPMQSGSDGVLKRMRRRYTARLYASAVATIRETVPDVSVTTDLIVGFPGETDEEFEETCELFQRMKFASAHVFPYSVRPGTGAAHHAGRVSPEVATRRKQTLLQVGRKQAAEFRRRSLGQVRPVLWETATNVDGLDCWSGLTDNYIRVVAGSSRHLANQVTMARLCAQEEDLVRAQVLEWS